MLSLAEMGVGSVITYNLYREIAAQNKQEIAKLMMIYKYVYRIVGCIVVIAGIILFPFLKLIIIGNQANWNYIQFIYIVQLIGVLCTYFLAYRRTLFIANQMEFICVKIDTVASVISQLTKIFILIFMQNYILYLSVAIVQNILTNFIISRKCNKVFSYAKKTKITRMDFQKWHFFKDIGNFMIHKISYLIYSGVDNIVISAILGINTVGLFSNYMLITSQVWKLISSILKPMQASIGNLIYSEENNDKGKQVFLMFDMGSFFLASFTSITFFVLFQPFIELWIGKQYLLEMSFVFLLAFNIYIGAIHEILFYFRSCFGEFERDRIYLVLAAIINLGLSITLAHRFGLSGIMFGTDIGLLFIWYGRIKVVFQLYFKTSYKTYICKQIGWIFLVGAEGILTYWLASYIPISIGGIIGKLGICLLIPNCLNLLIFHHTQNFSLIKMYVNQVLNILKKR